MRHITRSGVSVAAALLVTATTAGAQAKLQRHALTAGIHVGSPQWVSVGAGVALAAGCPSTDPEELMKGCHLWTMDLEPGVGGGKLAIGYGRGIPLQNAIVLRAVMLRTWGTPVHVARNQSFLGAEARIHAFFFMFTGGAFARVAGNASGDEDLTAGTLGLEIWW